MGAGEGVGERGGAERAEEETDGEAWSAEQTGCEREVYRVVSGYSRQHLLDCYEGAYSL